MSEFECASFHVLQNRRRETIYRASHLKLRMRVSQKVEMPLNDKEVLLDLREFREHVLGRVVSNELLCIDHKLLLFKLLRYRLTATAVR